MYILSSFTEVRVGNKLQLYLYGKFAVQIGTDSRKTGMKINTKDTSVAIEFRNCLRVNRTMKR
jgi:hypothetical protein